MRDPYLFGNERNIWRQQGLWENNKIFARVSNSHKISRRRKVFINSHYARDLGTKTKDDTILSIFISVRTCLYHDVDDDDEKSRRSQHQLSLCGMESLFYMYFKICTSIPFLAFIIGI